MTAPDSNALLASSAELARERPDLVESGKNRLGWLERILIRFVRSTFEPGRLSRAVHFCQRTIGCGWIHHCTKYLRHVHGSDRLPELRADQSFILVANHRSFFDLYVVFGDLVHRGLKHRIVFPVRSKFFYDNPLGLFVNGVMSFFAMYPPLFRERKKAFLNPLALEELAFLLRRGGMFAGIHPEGTRKRDDDPYTFLPAQRGVGKVIQDARVPVIPVFINGLINDLPKQVTSNFDRSGREIFVVFGKPIEFGDLLDQAKSPKVHQAISDRAMQAVSELGQEERALRAAQKAERPNGDSVVVEK
ncbi:MAG TPA: lysophospholipid acyltransferase family protein [Polyangiaceae bacterium]|jgi:1-acyl-sn-glycerol-3-phosphate acyltransferase|nr:lysophospholipid acyltransferase family protein [Polyangiaceae bacterium]